MDLQKLKKLNLGINIFDVTDPAFESYGEILDSRSFNAYFDYLRRQTAVPPTMNQYIAHDQAIMQTFKDNDLLNHIFNKTSLQYGYVNGNNSMLNALEFHHCPEVNLALTPLVLMLGKTHDIEDGKYDTKRIKAFYIPENTVVLLYSSTLHFSPCKVSDEGFKCGVILPYGTNMEFITPEEKKQANDKLWFKTNKWLIAHPENRTLLDLGAFPGLIGENLMIQYK